MCPTVCWAQPGPGEAGRERVPPSSVRGGGGGHPRGQVRWGPLAGVGPRREQAPAAAAARVVGAPVPGEGPGCSWDWAGSAGPLREPHRLLTSSCGCAAWMTRSEFSELPRQGLERHRVACTLRAHRQRGGQLQRLCRRMGFACAPLHCLFYWKQPKYSLNFNSVLGASCHFSGEDGTERMSGDVS